MTKRRRVILGSAVGAATVVGSVVWFWFEPQKLLIDEQVDEAVPAATGALADSDNDGEDDGEGVDSDSEPATPEIVLRGQFRSLDHPTSGEAQILELGAGQFVLRLENLKTDNGPDLKVYLSPHPADADADAFGRGFLDLGALKGNIGSQNYEIPPGTDVSLYKSAVVWCRRFSVGFGVAPLD